MTAEALSLTPEIYTGVEPKLPLPPIRETPFHLRRNTLKKIRDENGKVPEILWDSRAKDAERKVMETIASQTHVIERITTNPRMDTEGPDLHIFFKEDFPIGDVWIEVKSSTVTLRDYKDKIKNSLPEGKRNMEEVHKWMTEQRIILINGGESHRKEKTPEEILVESFYPKLNRIVANEIAKRASSGSIQVFPSS